MKFSSFIATTAITIAAIFSATASAQSHYEAFLTRSEAQQFNTSIFTLPSADPISVQSIMGKPAVSVEIDIPSVLTLSDFQIEVPGLEGYYAVAEKVIENSLGGETWIGDVVYLDPTGFNTGIQGRAYFVENENGITGTIHAAGNVLQIYPDGAGGQLLVSEDASAFDSEGEILSATDLGEVAASPLVGGRRDGPNVATLSNPYTIDVLWVTTQLARDSGADMEALIELATTTGNDVLINSEVPAQLRVVGIHDNTTYTEDSGDMRATLYALRNTTDGLMDEVHGIRADLGADLVAAVSGATNYCGIAYLDSNYGLGFSVTGRGCMSSYTPIHELGHNFGAHHDIANGTNFDYSFGQGLYNNTIDPYWRTVMSYQCPGGGCNRVPYYSNPNLTYNGLPLGDPDEFDNARVLRVRVAEVASFAASLWTNCTEHTSSNSAHVSAGRAYTETVFFTTRYYAVGSEQQLSGYSFSTTTLAEEPTGYFTPGTCGTSTPTETPFAPEVQNLKPSPVSSGLRLEGEVFDANADDIASVQARENGSTTWTSGTISNGTFSIEFPATVTGSVSVDIRTEDIHGDSFEFSTTFDIDIGEPPVLEFTGGWVIDDRGEINGHSIDPDNEVYDLFYQVDGAGDPETGTWTNAPVSSHYWTLEIPGFSPGVHTVHVYGVDETGLRSNVIFTELEFLPLEAPDCVFAEAAPSSSRVQGEVDLVGFVSDVNNSDIRFDYQINSGGWVEVGQYHNVNALSQFYFRLPEAYPEDTFLNIEMRAVDSSDLETHCGTQTLTIQYPTEDLAPSCEIVEVFQTEGAIRFLMTSSDPNGDLQQMFGKTAEMTEWLQTWPGPITTHQVGITGFGDVVVQGRVVDSTGLEGLCETTYTVVDESRTPEINYAWGEYNVALDTVVATTEAFDDDGDVVSVEFREIGTSTWLAASLDPEDYWLRRWTIDLGLLSDGDYMYEVRASDAGGRVSDTFTFEFNVERELPPTLDSLTYVLNGRTVLVQGAKSDPNDNARYIWYKLDDQEWESFWENDPEFSFAIHDLEDGPHTLEVYVADTWELRSDSQFINFDIDPGLAPVITSATYSILSDRVVFDVIADDVDEEDLTLYVSFDGVSQGSYINGTYQWSVTWLDPGVGTHTAEFYALDDFGNQSGTVTVDFEITETTPCFEDTNTNHVTAGRARSQSVCSFELFGNCYGTITTTWYAIGSDDNLGTSGSAVTSLLETSAGYYELGACNDTSPPVITLNGDNPLTVYQGQTYQEPGATAEDNVDGTFAVTNITSDIDTSIVGTYTVTYRATDSSGNAATPVTRTVNVIADDVKPLITVPSGLTYEVVVGSTFTNPTALASDNVDGDISSEIVITGSVDTNILGQYLLRYNVSDSAGNNADEVVVTVDVVDQPISSCFTSTLTEHVNAGRAYEQYYSYYSTGTGTYLGSTFNDANKVISLEETSPGNWSQVSACD